MPVADAFLSAFLQVLFDRLASRELLNIVGGGLLEVDVPLKKLASTASKIKAVLEDAEEKQFQDAAVKMWLDDLHDVMDEAENILDEVATERNQLLSSESETSISTSSNQNQVHSIFASVSSSASAVLFKTRIVSKITDITERLGSIAKARAELGLRSEGCVKHPWSFGPIPRSTTTSSTSLVGDCICGREDDLKKIVGKLLEPAATASDGVAVIPIVGLGGVGKTTMAQLLYNDKEVKRYFDVQAWAYVSDEFDLVKVTKGILESLGDPSCRDYTNLEPLQCTLRKKLVDRKYLIVFDDVWSEDYDKWELLLRPLRAGGRESKIIVTTRNENVAQTVRSGLPSFHLKELTEDHCWSLFAKHAFANIPSEVRRSFEEIGKEIAKKCRGLPLAAKALGGLLRSKLNVDEWQVVLNNSKLCDSWEHNHGILPVLSLSYHHLPSHLKPCFAYYSIFPKGYKFEEEELVHLWIAQGFVQQPEGNAQIEDVARKYFRDLISSSLLQCSSGSSNAKPGYLMHDLINDLARFVAGKSCFRLERNYQSQHTSCKKAPLHLSYFRGGRDVPIKFEALKLDKSLRTFLPLDDGYGNCRLSDLVIEDLLSKQVRLRVFSLSHYNISELPDSVHSLKHLRYLNLSHTEVKKLPDSTAKLYNLQTLILFDCRFLVELPEGLVCLSNLRHLNIMGTKLQVLPPQMGRLKNLQMLPRFIVGRNGGSGIQELRDLDNLRGELSIEGLQNVENSEDAKSAYLRDKKYLKEIKLKWCSSAADSLQPDAMMKVLDMLEPHRNITSLKIEGYGGAKFSSWLGDPLFYNIVSLALINCRSCTFLPPLGQLPSLKELLVEEMPSVESVGHEFYCIPMPFQKLQTLKFNKIPAWKEWTSSGVEEGIIFPSLLELHLYDCPQLSGKVPNLPLLTTLVIRNCKELKVLPSLPTLQKLDLEECDEMIIRGVGPKLQICNISKLKCLPEGLLEGSNALKDLKVTSCDEITTLQLSHRASHQGLEIRNCPAISRLAEEECILLCTIERLEISCCKNLKDLLFGLHDLTSLVELRIIDCPKLEYYSEKSFPPKLRRLCITKCTALQSLLEGLMKNENVSLEFLEIEECSFPVVVELPTTVKKFKISRCSNLEVLPEGLLQKNMSLECLYIHGCTCTSSPSTNPSFPSSSNSIPRLRELEVRDCVNFVSLPCNFYNFIHLDKLLISNCPSFESFPDGGLPSNLTSFSISKCGNLKSLPDRMHNLVSLKELVINSCPLLDRFPERGLPTSLISLQIVKCSKLGSLSNWKLDRFWSLKNYVLDNNCPDSGLP